MPVLLRAQRARATALRKIAKNDAEDRFEAIASITARLEPDIIAAVSGSVGVTIESTAVSAIADSLRALSVDGVLDALNLDLLEEELARRLTPTMATAIVDALEFIEDLETQLVIPVSRDRALDLASTQSARLVTNITDGTRRAIRNEVSTAIRVGENPNRAAARIRPLVGLTEPHARAVTRQFEGLIADGVRQDKALEISRRYAGRLLDWRARTIARTEMLWSANAAQQEVWRTMIDEGLLPRDVGRVWVTATDDRVCPECAPMDGTRVEGIDSLFESDTLGVGRDARPRPAPIAVTFPPLHPNCRCTLVTE